MVMYRSHMHKGLKRNFQLMPGAQWLELLCRQGRQNQRAPPGDAKGIDGLRPPVRELTYHPVPDIA